MKSKIVKSSALAGDVFGPPLPSKAMKNLYLNTSNTLQSCYSKGTRLAWISNLVAKWRFSTLQFKCAASLEYKTSAMLNWDGQSDGMTGKVIRLKLFRFLYMNICKTFGLSFQIELLSHMKVRIEQAITSVSTDTLEKLEIYQSHNSSY